MRKINKKIVNFVPLDKRRFKSIYLISLFIITCLSIRVLNLQFLKSSNFKFKAIAMQNKRINAINSRRPIVDKNNRLIAFDKPLYRLWAHPKYFNFPGDSYRTIRTVDEVVDKLSIALNIDKELLNSKFNNYEGGVKLFDELNEEDSKKIKNLHISGLDLELYSKRFYPQGHLYSNIVGFVNDENIGSAGLELHLDEKINILNKSNILKKGGDGTPLPDSSGPKDFVSDDQKIILTIDSRLQKITFDVLVKQVKEWKAKKGFAMVMNVNNGEILSLVSAPSYDPNEFWKYDQSLFKGWYMQDLFEPGSTFKPINLAMALEAKVVDKNGFVQDDGNIKVGGWNLYNWNKKGNGYINYPEVLQVSSNIGMIKIMQKLHPANHWEWLNKLGINKKIDTDLYESTPGYLKSKDIFVNQPIEQAVASFGQGFSISPLKLAQIHAILANGGYEIIPHVTQDFKIKDKKNKENKLFSSEVSKTILEWMETVVENGTGNGSKIDGYRIGGKTGTSQKAINGIYTTKKVCSFVATLPINDPKYLVLVVVDEPSKAYAYGSTVAVPVAKEIIESLIVLEKIPPSSKENKIIVKKP